MSDEKDGDRGGPPVDVIAADVMCGTPAAAAAPGRRPFFLGSA
jgi:hypothetical protein